MENGSYGSETEEFTADQLDEIKEAFSVFDEKRNGTIKSRHLGTVMRSLGIHPTYAELDKIIADLEPDAKNYIKYDNFLPMFIVQWQNRTGFDEYMTAFEAFDRKGDGTITKENLRIMLTTTGDVMTEEEADKIIDVAELDGDGDINYEALLKIMI